MVFPGGEMDQILAVQFERGNLVTDGFNRPGCRFPDCLPDFFQNALNLFRKACDVCFHRREFYFAGHGWTRWLWLVNVQFMHLPSHSHHPNELIAHCPGPLRHRGENI
jgi:hypothetical protein